MMARPEGQRSRRALAVLTPAARRSTVSPVQETSRPSSAPAPSTTRTPTTCHASTGPTRRSSMGATPRMASRTAKKPLGARGTAATSGTGGIRSKAA